jgi:diacylglycerol kinase (ATP)
VRASLHTQIDSEPCLRQHSQPVQPLPHHNSSSVDSDLLLVNPLAGAGRARAALPALEDFAAQRGWNVEICITKSTSDLVEKARNAAQGGRQRILVLGGDGTFQLLLNSVFDQPDVILGIIPAGGGNDLATALGLPSDPLEAAASLLEGEVGCLDVAHVRTADGMERLYTGGGGVGLDAEASKYASGSYRRIPGRARYLLAAIRALLSFRAFHVRITLLENRHESLECSALLAAVLNTPSYGAGLYLAPQARADDGILNLVLLENLRPMEILRLLPAFAARGALNTTRIRRFTTTHVRIETDSPLWFHGDGELLGRTPVEITVMPRAIRILRARQKADR